MTTPDAPSALATPHADALARPSRPLARWNARARAMWRGVQIDADRSPAPDEALSPWPRRAFRIPFYRLSFFAFVLAPALATVVYLAFLASDQFVAETKFALRTAQIEAGRDKSAAAAGAAGGASSSTATTLGLPAIAGQDAHVVAAYVRSPAIFADLPAGLDVRAVFRRPEADFWARLPDDASAERLVDYWRSMVSTYVDTQSGVVTVSVRAFRRDDALALAQAITQASEKLVNDLSARARADAVRRAEAEVQRAQERVKAALAEQRAFRDTVGVISPASEAEGASKLLLTAMAERIRLQSELDVAIRVMSPNAPTLASMRARLQSANQEIDKLKSQLTGTGAARTVSASIARYEELELQRQFAEKLFLMAQEALERARQKAERQSVYLSAFVPPMQPEEAQFPRRLEYSLLLPLGLLVVWGIGAMLAATVQDHRV
jgi:capsular polysaccharide transport system permease protein